MHQDEPYVPLGEELPMNSAFIDEFFRPFVVGGAIQALVSAMEADEEWLRLCARRSYTHRNGFDKVVLAESQSGRKLTWHRWHAAHQSSDTDFHNHRWDFASYVVSGSIELSDFVEDADGPTKVEKHVYSSPGGSESFSLHHVGPATLRMLSSRQCNAGQFYFQPHEVVHQAGASTEGASTVIVQGPVKAELTDVYLPVGSTAPLMRDAVRLDVETVRRMLGELAASLD